MNGLLGLLLKKNFHRAKQLSIMRIIITGDLIIQLFKKKNKKISGQINNENFRKIIRILEIVLFTGHNTIHFIYIFIIVVSKRYKHA